MKTVRTLVVVAALCLPQAASAESTIVSLGSAPVRGPVLGAAGGSSAVGSVEAPSSLNPTKLYHMSRSADPAARLYVAGAIGKSSRAETVHAARVLVTDPDVRVRRALAESLAQKAAKRWIPLLTEAIDDADADVRATAARALVEHGPEVFLAPMIRLLDDPSPSVRRVAIDGLAGAGTPGLTALLAVHTGSRPASAQVVDEVDDALHRVAAHHPDALVALIDLGKVDRTHTQRVANLLADCGPVGTDMLMAEMDAGLTQKAFYARRALAAYPGTAVPLINRRLLEVDLKDTKSALITPYLEVLRAAGDARALPALERLAKSKRPYLRAETMLVLGHIDDARAVELLVAGLTDADSDVRGAAADGLGQQRSVDGIKPLIRLVARGDAVSVKAIQALGKIGDARAALVLEQQLASDNPTVRRYACEALENIGHTSARDGLLGKLDDPDPMVRYTASRALGSME